MNKDIEKNLDGLEPEILEALNLLADLQELRDRIERRMALGLDDYCLDSPS